MNPSSPKLFLVGVFYHTKRYGTGVRTQLPCKKARQGEHSNLFRSQGSGADADRFPELTGQLAQPTGELWVQEEILSQRTRWREMEEGIRHPPQDATPGRMCSHQLHRPTHKQNQQGLQKTKQGTRGQWEGTDGPLDPGGLGGGGPPGGSKAELLRASATQLRTRVQCWTWEKRGMSRQV